VISEQDERSARSFEAGHAVRISRYAVPVGHGLTTLVEDGVGKSLGQIETPRRIGNERAHGKCPRLSREQKRKSERAKGRERFSNERSSLDAVRNAH
jgi:hypothetical protein